MQAFDLNHDGVLDEGEFRICLEKLNIQLDDVQALALFAYFDHNNDGFVEWEDFADHGKPLSLSLSLSSAASVAQLFSLRSIC